MASFILQRDEELQRDVAIKVSLVASESLQAQMRQEAAKLAQLESPGIVPVYHIGTTDDGAVYIVQKYIKGYTLRDLMKKQTLSPARAVQVTQAIAENLEPAHLRDILHRDLKPDNILIDQDGKPWIADFGLAISEDEQLERGPELAGTLPYMSPEQVRGRVDFLDPRSDIWALGVMYYEMLTGKRPFSGKSRESFAEQICQLDPRPLQQRAPGHLTAEMNAVFLRCCAKKPSDRYATVRELIDDLSGLIESGLSNQNISGAFMSPELGDSTLEFSDQSDRSGYASRPISRSSGDSAVENVSTRTLKTPLVRGMALTAGVIGLVAVSVVATVFAISKYLPTPVARVESIDDSRELSSAVKTDTVDRQTIETQVESEALPDAAADVVEDTSAESMEVDDIAIKETTDTDVTSKAKAAASEDQSPSEKANTLPPKSDELAKVEMPNTAPVETVAETTPDTASMETTDIETVAVAPPNEPAVKIDSPPLVPDKSVPKKPAPVKFDGSEEKPLGGCCRRKRFSQNDSSCVE